MNTQNQTQKAFIQLKKVRLFFLFMLFLFFGKFTFAQLSGVYTAGSASDDFPLIEDAINALEIGGIAADVEILISTGAYNTLDLTDFSAPVGTRLTFSSATGNPNDVSFKVANITECSRVELQHMTFNMPSPTTESSVVHIVKSDSIRLLNCRIFDTTSTWTVWNYAPLEVDYGWEGGAVKSVFVDSCFIYSRDGILVPKSVTRQTVLEKGALGKTHYKNDSIFGSIKEEGTSSGVGRFFKNCYLKPLQGLEGSGTEFIDSCEIFFYPWDVSDTIGSGRIKAHALTNTTILASSLVSVGRDVINCNISGNFWVDLYAGDKVIDNYVAGISFIDASGTLLFPRPLLGANVFEKYVYLSGGGTGDAEMVVANNLFLDTVEYGSPGTGSGGAKLDFYHNNFADNAPLYGNAPGSLINNNFQDITLASRNNYLSHNNYNWQDSSTLYYSYFDDSPVYYDPQYTGPDDLHVNNPSIMSAGRNLAVAYLNEDFEGDVRDITPTIGADESCLTLPLPDSIRFMCKADYILKMCDFDPSNHYWSSNVVEIDSTLASPAVHVNTIIHVYLKDSLDNIVDSTVLFPELPLSRKRNLYGFCGFEYRIATYNQPGVDVLWSPGDLFSDSTNHITTISLDTTTTIVATQDFGHCGVRYDSIVFNIIDDPFAHIMLDSFACLDFKFRTVVTCYDSIIWYISDGTYYYDEPTIWHSFEEEGDYDIVVEVWKNGSVASDVYSAYFVCLGTEENEHEDFKLFPNPALNGYFNVVMPSSMLGESYILYTNVGQVIRQGVINAENMTISTEGLDAGMYFFKVGRSSKKVLIKR